MAGPGRPPKPASQRRRRNIAPPTTKLPATGGREVPPFPLAEACEATRDWWRRIWESPMAAVWLDADIPALWRLAQLVEWVNRGTTTDTKLLAEIRQIEDRFGLSPLARRRLQYEVDQAAAAEQPKSRRDDERFLRAVS